MRKALPLLLAALAGPGLAGAAGLELAGYGSYTFPFYSQTFRYDPGPVTVPIPGVSVDQGGSFEATASGGLAFCGAATFYVTDGFGFELRHDRADVTVETKSASYTVRVGLPAPLSPVVADLALGEGTAELEATAPWSLNLKLRTGGSVRFTASGGVSRLSGLQFDLQQTVGLGVIAFDLDQGHVQVGTVNLQAALSAEADSVWGGNLGLGFEIPLGEHLALLLEGRGFYFPKQTIEWAPVPDRPLTIIEQALLDRLLERLPPVEFEPWWAQASAGLAIRF
jgi:hypothetical protein